MAGLPDFFEIRISCKVSTLRRNGNTLMSQSRVLALHPDIVSRKALAAGCGGNARPGFDGGERRAAHLSSDRSFSIGAK
jgi:hypothetical protein